MRRWRRFLGLAMACLMAVTLAVGLDAPWAEARVFRGGSHHSGFRHSGFRHQGVHHSGVRHSGFRHHGYHHGFRHGHHHYGNKIFLGVGLGFVGFPYAYSAYYPTYPTYPGYSYTQYPAYYGACYAYDAYGRCLSYAPAAGYPYPY